MSTEQSSTATENVEGTKRQIRALVNEISQLSRSDIGPEQYYAEFLPRIVSALAAVGGAVWVLGEGGRLQLAYHINLSQSLVEPGSEDASKHVRVLADVIQSGEPKLVPPQSGYGEDDAAGNPTNYLLVLAPLRSDNQVEGVLEIFQRPNVQPASQRGYLQFVVQMCELAGDWLKSQKLRQFTDRQSLWAQADQFARIVHEGLDIQEVCYAIANEGRRLIGCDRLSVGVLKGRKCVVKAVSGQDTMDDRSNVVAMLGRLASKVVATDEPLWYTGSTEDLPPQIESAVNEYVEESHTKNIVVMPLRRPEDTRFSKEPIEDAHASGKEPAGEVIGALIVEQIESTLPQATLKPRLDLVYEHSSRAMANAWDYNTLFLMPVWRQIGRAAWVLKARTLPKTLAISTAVLAIILALIFVPASFNLEAEGKLVPKVTRDVFADTNGVVKDVFVEHGHSVEKGQKLLQLENIDLEVKLKEIHGQLQTVREKKFSARRRLQDAGASITASERAQLAGQISEAEQSEISLKAQLDLLQERLDNLMVTSPIDGQVITWDPKKNLERRTVNPGEVLLTIADPTKEWEVDLFMSESRTGHVVKYQDEAKERAKKNGEDFAGLDVVYVMASDPNTYHYGKLKAIEYKAEKREEQHSVKLVADMVDRPEDLRPGTTCTGEVKCGKRSLGYVWIHEAIEWFVRRVWF